MIMILLNNIFKFNPHLYKLILRNSRIIAVLSQCRSSDHCWLTSNAQRPSVWVHTGTISLQSQNNCLYDNHCCNTRFLLSVCKSWLFSPTNSVEIDEFVLHSFEDNLLVFESGRAWTIGTLAAVPDNNLAESGAAAPTRTGSLPCVSRERETDHHLFLHRGVLKRMSAIETLSLELRSLRIWCIFADVLVQYSTNSDSSMEQQNLYYLVTVTTKL